MPYPKGYEHLGTLGVLPRVVSEGLKLVGTVETPGAASNPIIMAWRDELNRAGKPIVGYSNDGIPWCGLYMAIVALRAGKPVVANPLWARNWATFGAAVARNRGTAATPKLEFLPGMAASLGDVLVFVRDGGGHVGIYIGEDGDQAKNTGAYHVLGGNQSDQVCIRRIERARCIAVRRPPFTSALPASAKPYRLTAAGAISRNEA
ncbi:hypothetical protein ACFB49_42440 [Sphingomonas sp. DBB INV C78]|uniref:TIGR02594 family protein n=1 Tax=Sphingomonas sp. DBB INV C78 TaxID=3349434 RepID=UPI0036D3B0FD